MDETITIDGYDWELTIGEGSKSYECRGDVEYNDDHDEVPEEELWASGHKLRKRLIAQGHDNVSLNHSEKGWCEVQIWTGY